MNARAALVGALIGVCCLLGASSALAAAPFTAVAGSPFSTGNSPSAVAFSPSGGLLAATNSADATISLFSASSSGALTPVAGPPVATGSSPNSIAFSPGGGLLATANNGDGTVSVFSVSSTGALTPVTGSPYATGAGPTWAAFSPNGGLLATANFDDSTVSVFAVSPTGALTEVGGSPFTTGAGPDSVQFSPGGGLLATANSADGTVSVFSVSSAGTLAPLPNSPYPSGGTPDVAMFSPNGGLLASASYDDNTVWMYAVSSVGGLDPALTPALTLIQGSPFPTGTNPTWAAFSPTGGLLTTANQGDNTASVFSVSPSGALTAVTGSPIATGSAPNAVAFSPNGGLLASADENDNTVSVFSVAPPSVQITAPAGQHTYNLDQQVATSFSCVDAPSAPGLSSCRDSNGSTGSFFGSINTMTAGAHSYSVTATSKDGQSATATISYVVLPAGVTGPVPTRGCPLATGRLSGGTLGLVSIGMTRAQARHRFPESRKRADRNGDVFCLTPNGVRVGFASKALLQILSSTQRKRVQGRVVLALSADPLYAFRGLRGGATLHAAAAKRLHLGVAIHAGGEDWYLAANPRMTAVVEVHRGIVQAVGVANVQLTHDRRARLAFVKTFA